MPSFAEVARKGKTKPKLPVANNKPKLSANNKIKLLENKSKNLRRQANQTRNNLGWTRVGLKMTKEKYQQKIIKNAANLNESASKINRDLELIKKIRKLLRECLSVYINLKDLLKYQGEIKLLNDSMVKALILKILKTNEEYLKEKKVDKEEIKTYMDQCNAFVKGINFIDKFRSLKSVNIEEYNTNMYEEISILHMKLKLLKFFIIYQLYFGTQYSIITTNKDKYYQNYYTNVWMLLGDNFTKNKNLTNIEDQYISENIKKNIRSKKISFYQKLMSLYDFLNTQDGKDIFLQKISEGEYSQFKEIFFEGNQDDEFENFKKLIRELCEKTTYIERTFCLDLYLKEHKTRFNSGYMSIMNSYTTNLSKTKGKRVENFSYYLNYFWWEFIYGGEKNTQSYKNDFKARMKKFKENIKRDGNLEKNRINRIISQIKNSNIDAKHKREYLEKIRKSRIEFNKLQKFKNIVNELPKSNLENEYHKLMSYKEGNSSTKFRSKLLNSGKNKLSYKERKYLNKIYQEKIINNSESRKIRQQSRRKVKIYKQNFPSIGTPKNFNKKKQQNRNAKHQENIKKDKDLNKASPKNLSS
jgi:hypothetical protein